MRGLRSLISRIVAIVVLLGVVALAATSISIVPPLSGKVTTLSGRPLPGAYLAYLYKGSRFNFVDSLSYYRPGGLLRTDATATYDVPGFMHIHRPLDGGLVPWIEWIYVPKLHHFFGPIAPATETIPGLMENDRSGGVVRLADLTDDPERWSQTIRRLDNAIRVLFAETTDRTPQVPATDAVREELRTHLQQEFRAFMQRYENAPRSLPDLSRVRYLTEDERRARFQQMQEDRQREPLWGHLMERLWPELAER